MQAKYQAELAVGQQFVEGLVHMLVQARVVWVQWGRDEGVGRSGFRQHILKKLVQTLLQARADSSAHGLTPHTLSAHLPRDREHCVQQGDCPPLPLLSPLPPPHTAHPPAL